MLLDSWQSYYKADLYEADAPGNAILNQTLT